MAMYDPPHPGELVRDCIEGSNWTVTAAAQRIGVTRAALSCVLNGRAAVSPAMALAFERLGWSDADHGLRMQGRTEGLEFERRLLGSQAARRFGADTGQRLSALLADVSEPERMAAMGDAIIDCGTGAELLAAARRIVGAAN